METTLQKVKFSCIEGCRTTNTDMYTYKGFISFFKLHFLIFNSYLQMCGLHLSLPSTSHLFNRMSPPTIIYCKQSSKPLTPRIHTSCMARGYLFPLSDAHIYTFRIYPHIIIATPTAPPTTANISFPKPMVLGAKPVCNPALAAAVELASPTPAVPLGMESSTSLAATTATDVTVDLLPSGRVVVRREVVVCGSALRVVVASLDPDPLPLGAMVREPPPTVVTMVTPWALTLVTTSPSLRVLVTRLPWALVVVMTAPAVRGPVSALRVLVTTSPSAFVDVMTSPSLRVLVTRSPWALVDVTIAPAVRGSVSALRVLVTTSPSAFVDVMTSPAENALDPAAGVVAAPGLEASSVELAVSSVELAPGARGEVLVERTVVGTSDILGDSVVRLPSGKVLTGVTVAGVTVAIGATGVTSVVAGAESETSGVLLLPGTMGSADVVIVSLLGVCRLANATMLLAIDASSLCKA